MRRCRANIARSLTLSPAHTRTHASWKKRPRVDFQPALLRRGRTQPCRGSKRKLANRIGNFGANFERGRGEGRIVLNATGIWTRFTLSSRIDNSFTWNRYHGVISRCDTNFACVVVVITRVCFWSKILKNYWNSIGIFNFYLDPRDILLLNSIKYIYVIHRVK